MSGPIVIGRRDGLTRVLPKEPGASAEVWLAMHEDLRTSRRVRRVGGRPPASR
ncbi:hypothetical protein WME89_28865 [Sorangium sp. So ce321]|uniref:hypothetical protein n=1 Tax=Sorangium sp. So ce321 TaxID=3133300 RepID=UPI003F60C9CB